MKLRISDSDYHRILNVRKNERVTIHVDESQVIHPEIVSIHKARANALRRDNTDFFYTAKQCVESLEMFHEIEVISQWDTGLCFLEGDIPMGNNLETLQ